MTIAEKHIQECAEEMGIDTNQYFSHEEKEEYKGFKIESWYDEDANSAWSAWQAFAMGIGTFSLPSREEAILAVKEKIDSK
jgi:hypothetical protein